MQAFLPRKRMRSLLGGNSSQEQEQEQAQHNHGHEHHDHGHAHHSHGHSRRMLSLPEADPSLDPWRAAGRLLQQLPQVGGRGWLLLGDLPLLLAACCLMSPSAGRLQLGCGPYT
jgi:hypothetical protein